jgi:hypothetical protein
MKNKLQFSYIYDLNNVGMMNTYSLSFPQIITIATKQQIENKFVFT